MTHVDYKARIEEGIRFPLSNNSKAPIALLNPNDSNVMHASKGVICPKYTAVEGIKVDKKAGSMPLGGTTYQTMQLKKMKMTRKVTRYGDFYTTASVTNYWATGRYDPVQQIFVFPNETYAFDPYLYNQYGYSYGVQSVRTQGYWTDTMTTAYSAYVPVNHNINGVIKAQTFLQGQERWTPSIKLAIESWSADAEITAVLCESREDGTPDRDRTLTTVTVKAAQFKAWTQKNPLWTVFPLDVPALMRPGLHTILFATTGNVTVATAEGSGFLGGTLFDSTDGIFFQGDLTKDLCFIVDYCKFDVTRLPVQLAGLNLAGGIDTIAIKAGAIVPTNASANYELQASGTWKALGPPDANGSLFGNGTAPYYDFRIMLTGNEWAMPIINMAESQVEIARVDAAVRHISAERLLPSAVTTVKVRATVEKWDGTRHTLVAKLQHGANYASSMAHSSVATKAIAGRAAARVIEWTFTFAAPGIDRFKIDLAGTTNNPHLVFHVEETVYETF